MAKYHVNNGMGGTQQNVSGTYATQLALTASSGTEARRFKIYDIAFGFNGTPVDAETEWDISRQTAAGTTTAITPNRLDPADASALTVAGANATVEGTITSASSCFYLGMNQRASYRWVARDGSELVAPATNLAGFAMRVRSATYTATATAAIWFDEQ
jgi:hypothetical protein